MKAVSALLLVLALVLGQFAPAQQAKTGPVPKPSCCCQTCSALGCCCFSPSEPGREPLAPAPLVSAASPEQMAVFSTTSVLLFTSAPAQESLVTCGSLPTLGDVSVYDRNCAWII